MALEVIRFLFLDLQLGFLLVWSSNTCNLYIADGQWYLERELNVFMGVLRVSLPNGF